MEMKTVLITGASSGIGMALAKELAMRGYHLILMARRLDLMQGWTQFIQTQHPDCQITVIASDVANHEQHMTDVAQAIEKAQGLDLVIANAGVGFNTNEWTNTWEGTKKIFDVNLLGAIATIETAKDFFLKQGHGHIVGITSMAS
ncbi:MAG: short chain dehydrogenase, partial [uncultured bacterium]